MASVRPRNAAQEAHVRRSLLLFTFSALLAVGCAPMNDHAGGGDGGSLEQADMGHLQGDMAGGGGSGHTGKLTLSLKKVK